VGKYDEKKSSSGSKTNDNELISPLGQHSAAVEMRGAEVQRFKGKEAKKKRSRAKLLPDWKLRQLSDSRKQ
jgi:hypothetical protein